MRHEALRMLKAGHEVLGGKKRMNTWQQQLYRKRQEEMLREDISYRQRLRDVCRNEKNLERLCSQYEAKAVEAEHAGHHALAVRLAAENARLKKHYLMSSSMRGSLEMAHAVRSSNRAMAEIMQGVSDAANSLLARANAPDLYATQVEYAAMQEYVQACLDSSGMLYEDDTAGENTPVNEEGERLLKALLSSEHQEKKLKLIRDTRTQLEKLQRDRSAENEGGK